MQQAHPAPDSTSPEASTERPTGSRVADVGFSAALGGAAAGALAGTLAGPVGAVVGAVVGALGAGYAGNEIAERVDRKIEEGHWRENFKQRPYVEQDAEFDDYGPAYVYGVDGFIQHHGRSFDDAESDLSRGWSSARGNSRLDWDLARSASRDAWERLSATIERAVPGDSDRDGR
jgi:hypothetical protein